MRLALVATLALLSSSLSAYASPIVFNANTSSGNVSGSITIDTVTGSFTALDLTDSTTTFSGAADVNYANNHEILAFGSLFIDLDSFTELDLIGVTTLKGYTGGPFSLAGDVVAPVSGNLQSTAATVTPEPSSIALLATGLLGVAGVVRKSLA